jgi:hypothetical protein
MFVPLILSMIYHVYSDCDLSCVFSLIFPKFMMPPQSVIYPVLYSEVLLFGLSDQVVLRMDCPMILLFTGFCVTFIFVLLFCMSGVYPYRNISLNLGTLCLYHSLTILLLKLSRIKPAFCFIARCTGYNVMLLKFVSDLRQVSGFLRVLYFPPPIKLAATT